MKKIIVACGSGVATSQTVASKVEDLCKSRGIPVITQAVDIRSLAMHARGADLYVSIVPYDKTDYGIPMVSGIPFLTGIGLDAAMDQVEKILKGKK
jgi:Phosphotransferase system, galactitol-specific IIB component